MFSSNPVATDKYRLDTASGHTSTHASNRRCCKCGAERLHWLMARIDGRPSARINPTKWKCKDGCAKEGKS